MLTLDVYSNGDLQRFLALLKQCEKAGITDNLDAQEHVQRHVNTQFAISKNTGKQQAANKNSCPECWAKLTVSLVNNTPCTQVGGHYTAVKICGRCDYEVWV